MISGAKILVTGVTGTVAGPVARALAGDNDVWGVARFSDADARRDLEDAGVTCVPFDFMQPDFTDLPDDFRHVLHFGVVRGLDALDFAGHIAGNAEVGGLILAHCRGAESFLHCSSTSVYLQSSELLRESAPLADNHRNRNPTYSISKIAAEAVIRSAARTFGVPTVIARLNVPYGDNGGMPARYLDLVVAGEPVPVHPSGPAVFTPIHEDDIVAGVPALLAAAEIPPVTVNWAGPQPVSVEEWCEFMAAELGRPVRFVYSEAAIQRVACDTTRYQQLVDCTHTVDWRDGMRRMVRARYPELLPAG
jgi:UDP-glucuronate 4-epimerase